MDGLKIYSLQDSSKVVFDSSIKPTIILGEAAVGTSNGSLTDDRLVDKNVWVSIKNFDSAAKGYRRPRFYVDGDKLYWDWDYPNINYSNAGSLAENLASTVSLRIIYGVY